MVNILVTGAAGFIGFHLSKELVRLGFNVTGLDNLNDYYDPNLKLDRLKELGIHEVCGASDNEILKSDLSERFQFINLNIQDRVEVPNLFKREKFDIVVNLAAQAGVRYSLENPQEYIDSNIVGFHNIIESCKMFDIEHLIYASSSSVYGENEKIPFSVDDNVDFPISLYAATKKSNELIAYTYSHLYDLKVTGLRFFTVYGPWGRPDMAMFLFTDAIINNRSIKVYNNGNLERDFTYINDIVDGIVKIVEHEYDNSDEKYNLYNIGNSKPVNLMSFIEEIENKLGISADKEMLPMQPGDVSRTWADVTLLQQKFNYQPDTSISEGVEKFIEWYKDYYGFNSKKH
ncbi:NAD-dependent epimerase/dehydratase family protein [Salegentibacter mishustinae]|uniref:NAD-dependent epimerase/dehydratase family protein n=1 Tax=Salegentibacter mishustinae TaxID=270918 RepID=UPI002492839D|nr:NAD-dependent epimerase/dehydratase family protein [Salegentibacter mishustinae]